MSEVIERCPTGIKGFDRLCQGGFVRNSDNLIIGGPGSGKTTFLLEFLWNGATKFNENGIYCSFEPDVVEILKDGMIYGWDFTKLSNEKKIKFLRFAPQTSIEELKSELTKIISKNDIKRICFDPISILAMNLGDIGKIRQTIFELSYLMKRLKVTSVFADETLGGDMGEDSTELEKTDILRFLSDSVTIFYESGIAGIGDRAIRIAKMRRTSHERNAVGMKITPRGIEVIDPSLALKGIPPFEEENQYNEEENQYNEKKNIQQPAQETETNTGDTDVQSLTTPDVQSLTTPDVQSLTTPDVQSLNTLDVQKESDSLSLQENIPQKKNSENIDKAKEFVRQTKSKGYSDEQIKEMFIQKGWSNERVEEIFSDPFL
jgi:circadian clock protein KaiC